MCSNDLYEKVSVVCEMKNAEVSVHNGEVSTVWRGVDSMHIAFIMERCP